MARALHSILFCSALVSVAYAEALATAEACECNMDRPVCPSPVVLYGNVVAGYDSAACSEIDDGMMFWDVQVLDVIKNEGTVDLHVLDTVTVRTFAATDENSCGLGFVVGEKYMLNLYPTGKAQDAVEDVEQEGEGTTVISIGARFDRSSPDRSGTRISSSSSSSASSSTRRALSMNRRQLSADNCGKVALFKTGICSGSLEDPSFAQRALSRHECIA